MLYALKPESTSENGNIKIIVILERPFAFLKAQLERVCEQNLGVSILINRRYAERRQEKVIFSPERRHGERRKLRNQIGKVVICD